MTALEEARRRYGYGRPEPEMTPHTAGADEPDVTPEQISGMIDAVFNEGNERQKQLDELNAVERLRDGTYYIKYAHVGQYADFHDRANHEYLKEKYPWLHDVSEGLGFDEDKGIESHGEFERFLASIPHEDWVAFLEDMESLDNYPLLDEDRASELEMEEGNRWVTEDGGPDLIKEMVKSADDSYEAYLLSKTPIDLVFEWMRETDHYPESQGQGDVWMDMDKFAKEPETQEWFLEHLDDDHEGWLAAKLEAYNGLPDDRSNPPAVNQFENLLRRMGQEDEEIAFVYNKLDAEGVWQLFLQAFPDEPQHEGDPYWYLWKPHWNEPGKWKPGYEADTHNPGDWLQGYAQALAHLSEQDWFVRLVKNWFRRGPKEHPELKFEALENEPSADDPEMFFKHGGGLQEELLYEDDKIRVFYPRDRYTLNYHLLNAGMSEIPEQSYRDIFKHKDIFVVQTKLPVDLLGRQEYREAAVIYGDSDIDLRVWSGSIKTPSLQEILSNPEYGRSIRRALLRYYRERLEDDPKAAHVLLQLGGGREIRRGERYGHVNRSDLGVAMGLYYVSKHKYRLAAKAFGRSLNTITPQGVWLVYDSVEDLTPVFKNSDAASTVFAHDHYDWFDFYYEKGNRPEVKDVIPYLDQEAINHIRSVMVNRRVYFPDTDEYVVTTPEFLAQYDDATLLDWLANPTDEDEADGVWDDIIEEIKLAGADILSSAAQDEVHSAWVKNAVEAIEGKEHKWTNHPTKKYQSGESMEAFKVFVPWQAIFEFAEKYRDEHGYNYDGDLENLAIEVNQDTTDPDVERYLPGWHDVNKEWAKENLHRIHELKPPEPIPGSPGYADPAQAELALGEAYDPDDPQMMSGTLSGVPPAFESRVNAVLGDSMREHDYRITDLNILLQPDERHSEEEIDASDGRLHNMRPPHVVLVIMYRTEPQQDWTVTQKVFWTLRGQIINFFRAHHLIYDYVLNPDVLAEPLPADTVIFQFGLVPVNRPPEPEPDKDEVPF